MNHITYLKRIRLAHNLLLVCAITLTALGFLMGGIAALAFGIFVAWRYHRCPKCNGEIDTRMRLKEETFCPLCGCYLKDGTEPEPEPGAEPKPGEEPEKGTEPGPDAEQGENAEAGENTEAEPGTESEPGTEPEPNTDPEPAAEPEPEPAVAAQ